MAGEPVVLVTNDDGIYSPGLRLLYEAVEPLGKAIVVAPDTPKSASGLGITLHKPLRLEKVRYWGIDIYTSNGTPSDIVYLALTEISERIDLVVSGVNVGDNTSVQVILSSGTVGAAAQAALLGIPAIAFSADVDEPSDFEDSQYYNALLRAIRALSRLVLEEGIPGGADLLSVNFPRKIGRNTEVRVALPALLKYRQRVEVNVDPRGKKYYWIYGEIVTSEENTDVGLVKKGHIVVTPLKLSLTPCNREAVEETKRMVDRLKPLFPEGEVAP
ncbi:MAG: 5'/3'-nucleotidase SurE [Desulfurococcales archaeon]|nr:5'/3'-nucleotidase SurE [Desulfurococcales archaeon]